MAESTPPTLPPNGLRASAAAPSAPAVTAPTAPNAASSAPKLPPPPKPVNPFVYLGIPQAVLDWRPKMPGPKMTVFLAVTAGLTGAYIYDRRECKRIQQDYIDKVRWMREQTLESDELARRIKVYGARVPEDGELERSSKWFKRYMRPIFVASGTDYVLKTGTNPGGLGRTLLAEIRARRIRQASEGVTTFSETNPPADNISLVLDERDARDEAREIEGGIVLLGRGALKEYLWALKRGYNETIDLNEEARLEGLGLSANERRKDGRWEREEEVMVRELEREDAQTEHPPFEEDLPVGLQGLDEDSSPTAASPAFNPMSYTPYRSIVPSELPKSPENSVSASNEPRLLPPPQQLPPQPPLLLVPFTHPFGIQRWPSKLVHFFNKRSDVRLGGECAIAAIVGKTRSFHAPTIRDPDTGAVQGLLDEQLVAEVRVGQHKDLVHEKGVRTGSPDLDFLAETDEDPYWFRRTYRKLPSAHEFTKRTYYKDELPGKLKTARELAGGREPTKAERNYPPKLESDLRKERLDKELKWRRELEGWAVVRSGSGIAWDENWGVGQGAETPLKVYSMPSGQDKQELSRRAAAWEAEKKRREDELEERLRSMPSPAPEVDEA